MVERIKYDNDYGQITEHTKDIETNNPYSYTGREHDLEDLYYYRARYYDPSTQRFISEDPIGFLSGDFNFYRYVGSDPVGLIDPFGLCPPCLAFLAWLATDGAVVATTGAVVAIRVAPVIRTATVVSRVARSPVGRTVGAQTDRTASAVVNTIGAAVVLAEGASIRSRTQEEEEECDKKHKDYKKFCDDDKPKRGDYSSDSLGDCKYQIDLINNLEKCIKKVEDFDELCAPGRHKDNRIKAAKDQLKKRRKIYNKKEFYCKKLLSGE